MGASVDCCAVPRLFLLFSLLVTALVVSGRGSVVFPATGRLLPQHCSVSSRLHVHLDHPRRHGVSLFASSASPDSADRSKTLRYTVAFPLGFQPNVTLCSFPAGAIRQKPVWRPPAAAFRRCLFFLSFFGSRGFQSSSVSGTRSNSVAYLSALSGRLLPLRRRTGAPVSCPWFSLVKCRLPRHSSVPLKGDRRRLTLALARVNGEEKAGRDGDSDREGDAPGSPPSGDAEDRELNAAGGTVRKEKNGEHSASQAGSLSDQVQSRGGGPDSSPRNDDACSSNLPDVPPGLDASSSLSASSSRPAFPPRVYSPIPEIVGPPGRAYPFPLPQLSSKLTGVPDAPKPTKQGQAEERSSRPSPISLPRPSYLRLLPHYPRMEPPPVNDGLLEEIFSATSREELHASLEKLQDSKYIEWLFTPHTYRDTEGFLAATDPDAIRARFAGVYRHHKEQLDRWVESLRLQPGRSVRLPALTEEERDKLLTLKVPKRFIVRRPDRLEKPAVALRWKEGGLAADRELIDAGGPGGFVRNLEVEAWAALFPVDEERHSAPTGAHAARERLELATRLQIREWQEERRAMEQVATEPSQWEGERRDGRSEDPAAKTPKGHMERQDADETLPDGLRKAASLCSSEEGTEKQMSARVREAAEALAKQQMLASMGLPSSVQALIARYGHITPDSPAMAAPDARSALQLLQRAVADSESFLLGHLHRGLQSDEDVQVVRRLVQAQRERHAAHGRPPPRTGHAVEFTPAMFQDWEETESYKEVLAVAAVATKRRLEAARRVVESADAKARNRGTPLVAGGEEKRGGGDETGQDAETEGTAVEEGEAEGATWREHPKQTGDGERGQPDPLPVPARLLQGAAAAAKGGIGARALEAVQWVLREEIRKEQLRRDNEEHHSMMGTMEANVVRARDERQTELLRQEKDLNLQQLRERGRGKTPDGSTVRESIVGRQHREQPRHGAEELAAEQTLMGSLEALAPTHEEMVVDRFRRLSKELGEASGLYTFESEARGPRGLENLRESEGNEAAQAPEKEVSAAAPSDGTRNATERTDGGGRLGTGGRSLEDASAPRPVGDIFAEMEEAMQAEWKRRLGYPSLKVYPGQLVKGKVVKVTPSFAYIHVGYVCEGELRLDEVLLEEEEAPKNGLKAFFSVGDEVFCEVIKVGDAELILSLQTLRRIAAWEQLLALQREDQPLTATVLHAHKGGVVVRVLGLRGFLPASQLPTSVKPGPQLVGAQLRVALLQADVEKQRLLVSSRIVHIREQMRRVKPDQVVEGEVVSIHPFGVMVQFGECRGLLHVSEVSAARVERLEDVLPLGSRVRALVLHYDKPTGKIALTTKLLERYPGEMVRDSQAVFDAAMDTAEMYAVRKREEKAARRQAAHQLIAALGLDPAAALGPGGEREGDSVASDEEKEHIDTSYARSYNLDQSGDGHVLWKGIGDDDSKVMTLLSRKLLEKAAARRRKSSGSRGMGKSFVESVDEGTPSGIELFRAEREKVLEAVKASGIQLKGAWNVPSVFEAEWETDEWLFE
ncbi:putative 30S ribosomal protein S1 [Neospora caninum Liverpool]|uniref:30S ribosomal protein S1, putative n=1 Tax=Neospora caninum (strain Liverpool) TaxID=572307 RepID=F0VD94_NEOCL|nr:putative 30S ribosomal protein S1 [Neospora caninum Liverpool]CBZ51609.1 putative 30S ribosomal protein S1 [Neospora caninum Liverpool]CEL65560.1 TPA: 30S ribosomal protein S1, putative [Neospora caninum Liverpool]|eukprot:XP_003881642.1 putative 30S ribosomal protein S1 [Neospora caninum Liverpool]